MGKHRRVKWGETWDPDREIVELEIPEPVEEIPASEQVESRDPRWGERAHEGRHERD